MTQTDSSEVVIPALPDVERRMRELDDRLYAKATVQYRNREIHPQEECYQLDGCTYISETAFETIAGDEREHYMAWKNGCIDECSVWYWNEPAVMSYLVDRSIEDDTDGDACCWIDAQSIGYARSCTIPPLWIVRHGALLGGMRGSASTWRIVAAIEDGLDYALYGHPNVDIICWDGKPVIVSACQSDRAVAVMVERDVVTMQAMLRGEPCSVPVVFDWRGVPRGDYASEHYRRFRAAKAAFDYAISWVDDMA